MNYLPKTKSEFLRHVLIWIMITMFLYILDPIKGNFYQKVFITFFNMMSYVFGFYMVSSILLPKLWPSHFFGFFIGVLLTIIGFVSIDYFTFNILEPSLKGSVPSFSSLTRMLRGSVLSFFFVFGPAIAFYLHKLGLEKIKIKNELEKSLITKELNFLKNQFNSHITFNFLNFCYSHVYKSSRQAAESIELFSSMLRYSLSLSSNEKVPLQKEIEYINNFIELQKLLSKEIYVTINTQGDIEDKFILPRILITFVENAFKHGEFSLHSYPIEIYILCNSTNLNFKVKNKINSQKKIQKTGIGKENVKQVLDGFYRNNYFLHIKEDEEYYESDLTLNLNF